MVSTFFEDAVDTALFDAGLLDQIEAKARQVNLTNLQVTRLDFTRSPFGLFVRYRIHGTTYGYPTGVDDDGDIEYGEIEVDQEAPICLPTNLTVDEAARRVAHLIIHAHIGAEEKDTNDRDILDTERYLMHFQ
ncbi:hypothetical protein [Spirosoma sordidisoli]|uniref:Uncharacterized protein n=1 Tax=Spirosoma sordidisoli TaxID=2502893 RepID=A0A4Q2UPW1_9BACT|nr:hypothetical protein [Spirosoma sordidisoli]RYC69675.1 hypothetical protein EQG79_13825 [Spirosoma sordidisoli]